MLIVYGGSIINIGGVGGLNINVGEGDAADDTKFINNSGKISSELEFNGAEGSGKYLTISVQSYTPVCSGSELQDMYLGTGGLYAIARPIDLTGAELEADQDRRRWDYCE